MTIAKKIPKNTIPDVEGHYDIDGVSVEPTGVVVAGDGNLHEVEPLKEFKSLNDTSIEEVQKKADQNSLELKRPKLTVEDGVPDKGQHTISTAKYYPGYEPYLEFETPG